MFKLCTPLVAIRFDRVDLSNVMRSFGKTLGLLLMEHEEQAGLYHIPVSFEILKRAKFVLPSTRSISEPDMDVLTTPELYP